MVPLDGADLFGPRDFLYYKLHFLKSAQDSDKNNAKFLIYTNLSCKGFPTLEVLQIFVHKNFSCDMLDGLSKRYLFLDYGTLP
jgi:hypothetical protein